MELNLTERICRLCLEPEEEVEFKGLFNNTGEYARKIRLISGIKVAEDPKSIAQIICGSCVKLLDKYYNFRLQMIDANDFIRANEFETKTKEIPIVAAEYSIADTPEVLTNQTVPVQELSVQSKKKSQKPALDSGQNGTLRGKRKITVPPKNIPRFSVAGITDKGEKPDILPKPTGLIQETSSEQLIKKPLFRVYESSALRRCNDAIEKLWQKKRVISMPVPDLSDDSSEDDSSEDGGSLLIEIDEIKNETEQETTTANPVINRAEAKLQFCDEMITEITKYLQPYRDESCGKITNDVDFVMLVNKLAFSVLSKEMKYCKLTNTALQVTDLVKAKTQKYVKKYMQKFPESYQREDNEPDYSVLLNKCVLQPNQKVASTNSEVSSCPPKLQSPAKSGTSNQKTSETQTTSKESLNSSQELFKRFNKNPSASKQKVSLQMKASQSIFKSSKKLPFRPVMPSGALAKVSNTPKKSFSEAGEESEG